jgi:transposase
MVIDKEDSVQNSDLSDRVANSILWIRDQKVMLSPALAELYGVEVRMLKAGKPKMAIVGAAMRKLVHLIYGVLKSGKPFDAAYTLNRA